MRNKPIIITLINLVAFLIVVPLVISAQGPLPEPSMPGAVEGTGTYFEITDSEYLNISLQSTKEITVILESVPKTISLYIKASTSTNSTILTIGGLEPNKTYYKFEDSYKNEAVFVSDNNGSYGWTQGLTQSHHIWFQPGENGTVFLPEDCSAYGIWNATTSTCTLAQDLTESVEITENNITLDCNGHSITGTGTGYGIYLNNKGWITVKNCAVADFSAGIELWRSFSNKISSGGVSNNYQGIHLTFSLNNEISHNNILNNNYGILLNYSPDNKINNNNVLNNNDGISLYSSDNTEVNENTSNNHWRGLIFNSSNNKITNNTFVNDGLSIGWSYPNPAENNIVENNTVNGKPLVYLENISDYTVTVAGQVVLVKCNNITVENLDLSHTTVGVELVETINSQIRNNNITSNNLRGVHLLFSSHNEVSNNEISNNFWGIYLLSSSNNKVYHNNFIDNPIQGYVSGGIGNLFDNNYPDGGNHWSDYVGVDLYSGSNQDEPGSDGMGDTSYTFTDGQDNYPFMEESGWVTNQPPIFSNLNQYKSDGQTEISESGITTESVVVFKATVADPDNDQVKLQVELKEFNQPFDESGILESDFIQSGNEAIITAADLTDGQYKWRARAVDSHEAASAWQEFGTAGNVDFEVQLPLSTKAANLAKQLANHPEAYLWAGKGWDYNISEFITSANILTGYTYWNPNLFGPNRGGFDTGIGVDCSGLITWAFNRANDPSAYFTNNFVKYVNTDGLHRDYQSDAVLESELVPGDAMFFDWNEDGYIDHTSMYVGESDGFDVVNARSIGAGIVTEIKDSYKELAGFQDFRRIHAGVMGGEIVSSSPVDLKVIDPDGLTIMPNSVILSDEEYIREIPGALYYLEMEQADDGHPIDRVYFPLLKIGDYIIEVLSDPDASPADIYSLEFTAGTQTITLADNVPIGEIPEQPYLVKVTETEAIPATPMKSFTTKEMKIHWKDKTSFTISGSLELPDEYQKEDLKKSALLSIKISDKLGKDKVIFKELKNIWLYQEPRKWKETNDSLNQGIDIKTAVIHWLEEKKCKFFKWWCQKKSQKNWFYIRGELSLEGIDVDTLPREATLILEIPMASNEEAGILAGIETIEFKKTHNTWFYHSLTKWKDWDDGWWKEWDDDEDGNEGETDKDRNEDRNKNKPNFFRSTIEPFILNIKQVLSGSLSYIIHALDIF